jgi:hypothetical protein
MRPTIRLSQAYLDARGWTLAEGAELLELVQANAVPAGDDDACPQCSRPYTEYQADVFVPDDPATVTSEQERGRVYVLCVCGAMYRYVAVDDLNAPTEEARVRAVSTSRTPSVVEEIAATDHVAVVVREEHPPARANIMTPLGSPVHYWCPRAWRYFTAPSVPPPDACTPQASLWAGSVTRPTWTRPRN